MPDDHFVISFQHINSNIHDTRDVKDIGYYLNHDGEICCSVMSHICSVMQMDDVGTADVAASIQIYIAYRKWTESVGVV